MKNFKIRTKMLLGYGALLLLIIVMTGVSLANQRKLSNLALKMYDGPYLNAFAASDLGANMQTMDISLTNMILEGTSSELENEYLAAWQTAQNHINDLQGRNLLTAEQYSTIEAAMSDMEKSGNSILSFLKDGKVEDAVKEMRGTFDTALATASGISKAIAISADDSARAARATSKSTADHVILIQDFLFVFVVLCAAGIALRMATSITNPVRKVAKGVEKIAKGDFEIAFQNENGDEIGVLSRQLESTVSNIRDYIQDISEGLGQLSQGNIDIKITRDYVGEFSTIKSSLNAIIDALNDTMSKIRACCDQVKVGANSLANSAQSLAQGSVRQTSAIEEFQASLSKVSELTAQDGQNAAHVKELSTQAWDAMQESDRQMKGMVTSMDQINDSSMEIAKVIKIIEDIAFQTNILALNAAVEAARAGVAGKGFAVVADEVRNLAGKSAQAANNTSEMINKAIQAVSGGMEIASNTASSIQLVGEKVKTMTQLLTNIDQSTNEQARAFSNMVSASEEISAVVHANSAAAEENSSASAELSTQADILDDLVRRFRLREQPGLLHLN